MKHNPKGGKFWDVIKPRTISLSKTFPIRGNNYLSAAKPPQPEYHMHYDLELGIVLSGRLRRYYQKAKADIAPGQAWFCGIWEPHGWEFLQIPCETVTLSIWPPMLATMLFEEAPDFNWLAPFTVPVRQRPQICDKNRGLLLALAGDIKSILAHPPAHQLLWLRLRLMEIIMTLCQGWSCSKSSNVPSANAFEQISRGLQMTFSSHNIVTTEKAAIVCGMAGRSFSNLFQRLMGLRFDEFGLRYRINSAAINLLRSEEPVKAVALKWGFSNASHFYHSFARYYGCTPKQYRIRHAVYPGSS